MKISSGKIISAQKVVIYGPEGIGKSTLASKFPDPLFIDTEGSTKQLDVKRFEKPSSWQMILAQIDYVIKNKPCNTLIIDTLDWAEALCLEFVCAKHNKEGIESFGYGNGYIYEKEEFGKFLNRLEEVINAGINVVLTAHAILRKFEQPDELGAYDRWELKLGKKTTNNISSMVKEWADAVLFCNYKTFAIAVDKNGKKHKGQGGKRVMYTSHHPCWDAKNRYGLPEETDMDYEIIRPHIEAFKPEEKPSYTATPAVKEKPVEKVDLDVVVDDKEEKGLPEDKEGLPKALADLMSEYAITEEQIRTVVGQKGYFPKDMPVRDYPIDFINGVLIGAWDQVYQMIKDTFGDKAGDLPF